MKSAYLVSYDIMDSERLHQVYKTMKGFGKHTQYSVFMCNLNPKEKVLLNEALISIMNQNEDRIMIVNLGPADGTSENRIEFFGQQEPLKGREPIIV